ncbi:hypothetical protein [[Eubacterium] hominis]|uniref:hypothetical protein n=1 Tax=[Eubacterium] hominis TaxID=2764325 RepID=UPI003A4DDCEF
MKKIITSVLCLTLLFGAGSSIHAEETNDPYSIETRDATMDHAVVRSQTFQDIGPHQFVKTITKTETTILGAASPWGGSITYNISKAYSYRQYSTKYKYKTIVDYYTSSGHLAYSRTYTGTVSGYYIEMI